MAYPPVFTSEAIVHPTHTGCKRALAAPTYPRWLVKFASSRLRQGLMRPRFEVVQGVDSLKTA
jgi:hypothetical protein